MAGAFSQSEPTIALSLSFPAPCPSLGGSVTWSTPRDIPKGKWVPQDLLAPVSAKPPATRAKPPPKGASRSIPVESGDYVQEYKVKWSRTKKFHTEPLKEQISSHWLPIERMHDFHIVATPIPRGYLEYCEVSGLRRVILV